jgi:hypothetical protein
MALEKHQRGREQQWREKVRQDLARHEAGHADAQLVQGGTVYR